MPQILEDSLRSHKEGGSVLGYRVLGLRRQGVRHGGEGGAGVGARRRGGAAAVGGRERNARRSCWRRCDESPKGICFTCTSATWGGSWDPYDHGPFFRSEREEEREEAQGPRHPPKTTAKDIIPGT